MHNKEDNSTDFDGDNQGKLQAGKPEDSRSSARSPSRGTRVALSELRRQLSEDDLQSKGVQKLLLEMLEEGDEKIAHLESFVNAYHDADKRAAVLGEKLVSAEK